MNCGRTAVNIRGVRDYVLGQPGAREFLDTYHRLLDVVIAGYRREGSVI